MLPTRASSTIGTGAATSTVRASCAACGRIRFGNILRWRAPGRRTSPGAPSQAGGLHRRRGRRGRAARCGRRAPRGTEPLHDRPLRLTPGSWQGRDVHLEGGARRRALGGARRGRSVALVLVRARGSSWPSPIVWGLWELRPELRAVPYLDDSSIHEQMVRFAATRISQGHLPLTSWFPYLGLGSPQFLHYQSLPSMTAGRDRHGRRPRHGVPLVDLPAARPVAARRLLGRPAVRPRPLDRRHAPRRSRRSSPRRRASATRPRPTSGSATACGPSSGRPGRCRSPGASPTGHCRRCAPRCPPSSSSW